MFIRGPLHLHEALQGRDKKGGQAYDQEENIGEILFAKGKITASEILPWSVVLFRIGRKSKSCGPNPVDRPRPVVGATNRQSYQNGLKLKFIVQITQYVLSPKR